MCYCIKYLFIENVDDTLHNISNFTSNLINVSNKANKVVS